MWASAHLIMKGRGGVWRVCVYVCVCVLVLMTVCNSGAIGWLRLVGSLKLQVSFAEYCLFNRALLQKRPIVVRSLLIVATP